MHTDGNTLCKLQLSYFCSQRGSCRKVLALYMQQTEGFLNRKGTEGGLLLRKLICLEWDTHLNFSNANHLCSFIWDVHISSKHPPWNHRCRRAQLPHFIPPISAGVAIGKLLSYTIQEVGSHSGCLSTLTDTNHGLKRFWQLFMALSYRGKSIYEIV